MAAPRASVVIPAYNAGAFLRPAVLSALNAPLDGGLEVVVVDDGSTDDCVAALGGLDVLVIRQKNAGEAAARNAGVRAATGRFVTFLDADDLLDGAGLAPRAELLETRRDLLAAGGLPTALIGERGEILAPVLESMAANLSFPMNLTLADYRADRFFPVSCSLYLYRREAFERVGPYDAGLAAAPDADFHFRLLALGGVPVLRVGTFLRRLHGANLSMADARMHAPAFRPEVLAAIHAVNLRHGLKPATVAPWEADYL
jgi:glycosyltransferase involved in cell wall biosynthesis